MFQILLAVIYLAFISLGLPDSMLGSAWPTMYAEFGVPLSYAGIIAAIISAGTVVSSLQSDRLTLKFGTAKVTAFSVAMTAAALFGFSFAHSFPLLCLLAVPYGLGAGSVDASLNNYVALHYESRHMSWLHCMWGVGAATGPNIMGFALSGGLGWNNGYRMVAVLQTIMTIILFLSLPLWKGAVAQTETEGAEPRKPMTLGEILHIPGAKSVFACFFCYCAIEQTAGLWACSYMNLYKQLPAETAASFASMFFIGITIGRAISGFLTIRFNDRQMIRLGEGLILTGILILLIPGGAMLSLIGLVLIGLGCAPIYPCIIHSTPSHFGAEKSQAVIGAQMAFAYMGILGMPPLFGIIANKISISLLPPYLFLLLLLMTVMHELLLKITATDNNK